MFRNFFRVREIYEILSLESDIYLSEIPINCLTFKRHHFTKFMITAKKTHRFENWTSGQRWMWNAWCKFRPVFFSVKIVFEQIQSAMVLNSSILEPHILHFECEKFRCYTKKVQIFALWYGNRPFLLIEHQLDNLN